MAILKLTEAGEEMTLDIKTAELVEGNFGMQAKFTDTSGDVLFVPLNSVERQLDRCGVAEVTDLTGKKIHFSRADSHKPGQKPYWNLDRAKESDVVKSNGNGTPRPTSLPQSVQNMNTYVDKPLPNEVGGELELKRAEIRKIHAQCFRHVLDAYVPAALEKGVEVDLAGVSAITFQLFKAQADAR